MITVVGDVTVGGCLTATAGATAAVDAAVGAALPEVSAKLAGFVRLATPSPSFDISAQLTTAASAYASAMAELAVLPGGATLAATLSAAVGAQTAALLAVKALDPSVALKVSSALSVIAGLNVAVDAGVSGPNINLATVNAQIAVLTALKATLEAELDLAADIDANLAVSGLRLYRFDGDISTAGADLQARITTDGLSGEFHFMVLLPTSAPAWTALQSSIRTS